MDFKIEMSKSFAVELRGFLNQFAGKCHECLYRRPENCATCPSLKARHLIQSLDSSASMKTESYLRKNPFVEHLACVISAIKEAKRPVFQREIKIHGMTRQSLFWDLKKMCQRGYIMRVKTDFGMAYKIGPKQFRLPS